MEKRSRSEWCGSLSVVSPGVEQLFDPATFAPVCTLSDGFYRETQQIVLFLVGSDVYQDYAPLIAGALLRVRLELCIVESFVSEAVLPFVRQNGLSWVLPAHETIETFLAGSIFAVAVNVIFIGSSKIISVIVIFVDFIIGLPFRLLGKIPVGDEQSPAKAAVTVVGLVGKGLEVSRNVAEFADLFVARYLALFTVLYIAIKFIHFRILPDIFP